MIDVMGFNHIKEGEFFAIELVVCSAWDLGLQGFGDKAKG